MMDTNLILIGPLSAGKSTVSKRLGEALDMPVIELDDIRWEYAAEIGYDAEYAEQLRREGGMKARGEYWNLFEVHGVERLLQDYPEGHILSFGAGHSVYDDPEHMERVQKVLAPYPYVLLLQPSPDVEKSLAILLERLQIFEPDIPEDIVPQINDLNRYFIEHPANAQLATHTFYSANQTPAETCAAILETLNLRSG